MVIEEMHFEFRRKIDKISSNFKKTWSDAEVDNALNNAITEFKEIVYSGNNAKRYKLGFEVTQQRIDMLAPLVQGFPKEPLLAGTKTGDIYEFNFDLLSKPYDHFIGADAEITGCNFTISIKEEQTGDLRSVLKDSNRKPSLRWRRAPGHIKSNTAGNSSLFVYTDGLFDIIGLRIDYLRKPVEVCLGTYFPIPTQLDPNPGILKARVNCDIPQTYHTVIVDIAVQEFTRSLEDINRLQLRKDRSDAIIN